MNALAATACATCLEIDLDTIRLGLEKLKPVKGRLEKKTGKKNTTIIDDTYNANPASFHAAIAVLKTFPGKHWLVLGDMGELGNNAEMFHREAGIFAKNNGIEKLFATGKLSRCAVDQFGAGGEHFDSLYDLMHRLDDVVEEGVHILVKGSRSMHMEKIVEGLEETEAC